MKAFSEKGDLVLRTLNTSSPLTWNKFYEITGINNNDAILAFLKQYKGFIEFTDKEILLTAAGKEFISTTSFVQQRDKQQNA